MDPMTSSVKANITIDDFDAICLYSDDKQWLTNGECGHYALSV